MRFCRPVAGRPAARAGLTRIMRDVARLPSVRGDLLAKLGRHAEAAAEFLRAASQTRNAREPSLLLERAATQSRLAGREEDPK